MRTVLLCLGTILLTACLTSRGRAENVVEPYVHRVFELVNKQHRGVARLFVPADLTARALLAGGAFYLAGDTGWVAEGSGRAGGPLGVRPLPTVDLFRRLDEIYGEPPPGVVAQKGDVVWLSYSSETYALEATAAKDLEQKGCLVVAFGPRPQDGPPEFTHWIDSLTLWGDDPNFTQMGNLLSLWTLTGEAASDTARQDRTLTFYQSLVIYGARERNDLYMNERSGRVSMFHDGVPTMRPLPAGGLARAYLEYVAKMLREIQEHELGTILKVGQEMARRAAESRPATLMVLGHLMPHAVSAESKSFHYLDFKNESKNLQNLLGQDGYFVWIGYVAVPLDLWLAVRRAGATAAWIVSPLPAEVDFRQFGDVVINQRWPIGDGAVDVPGYDVRILPPSGIAQLFIYELLVRAAGSAGGTKP
jgi:hypothetical protein